MRYPYANRIDPDEPLGFNYDVINPSSTDAINYYVEYTFIIADWTEDIVEVEGYFNSITGCEGNDYLIFDIEQSLDPAYDNAFLDFNSTFTGEFIFLSAHLHGGARSMYFANTETGDVVFSAIAHYDDPDHPSFLTIDKTDTISFKTKINERYRMASVYDSSERRDAVMAILAGYVIVEEVYSGDPLPQYFGHENPFAGPTNGELVGTSPQNNNQDDITDETNVPSPTPAPAPVAPQPQNNNPDDGATETGNENFAVLVSMVVLAFIVAAVLLVLIVGGLLAVVKYKTKRYAEVTE